jgi:predicted RNase H-like HicB family nuclease
VADDVWVADVPDVRFNSAHGETPEEAVRQVRAALAGILADAAERGIALPPTERPVLAMAS